MGNRKSKSAKSPEISPFKTQFTEPTVIKTEYGTYVPRMVDEHDVDYNSRLKSSKYSVVDYYCYRSRYYKTINCKFSPGKTVRLPCNSRGKLYDYCTNKEIYWSTSSKQGCYFIRHCGKYIDAENVSIDTELQHNGISAALGLTKPLLINSNSLYDVFWTGVGTITVKLNNRSDDLNAMNFRDYGEIFIDDCYNFDQVKIEGNGMFTLKNEKSDLHCFGRKTEKHKFCLYWRFGISTGRGGRYSDNLSMDLIKRTFGIDEIKESDTDISYLDNPILVKLSFDNNTTIKVSKCNNCLVIINNEWYFTKHVFSIALGNEVINFHVHFKRFTGDNLQIKNSKPWIMLNVPERTAYSPIGNITFGETKSSKTWRSTVRYFTDNDLIKIEKTKNPYKIVVKESATEYEIMRVRRIILAAVTKDKFTVKTGGETFTFMRSPNINCCMRVIIDFDGQWHIRVYTVEHSDNSQSYLRFSSSMIAGLNGNEFKTYHKVYREDMKAIIYSTCNVDYNGAKLVINKPAIKARSSWQFKDAHVFETPIPNAINSRFLIAPSAPEPDVHLDDVDPSENPVKQSEQPVAPGGPLI